MNIINCIRAQIPYLQGNECKVAHTEYKTYMCISVEKYKEKLHVHYLFFSRGSGGGGKISSHFV